MSVASAVAVGVSVGVALAVCVSVAVAEGEEVSVGGLDAVADAVWLGVLLGVSEAATV